MWELLTDVRPDAGLEPELRPDDTAEARWAAARQRYLGINRRGLAVWPTRNVVARARARAAASRGTPPTSGARWIWELEPDVAGGDPRGAPAPGAADLTLLVESWLRCCSAGATAHADELEAGMGKTVERLGARRDER